MLSLLYAFDLVEGYWRILYFAGFFTAILVSFFRININFHPIFSFSGAESYLSGFQACLKFRKPLFAIILASAFSSASYSFALILMNGFVPLISSVTVKQMLYVNTVLLVLDLLMLPLFGVLANRFTKEKLMIFSAAFAVVSGIPLLWLLDGASLLTVILVRFFLVLIGVGFSAPFHAWIQTLVPTSHRYTLISFGYALGSQLLGGPTLPVSLWLYQQTNLIVSASWYWMLLGLMASYAVYKQKAYEEIKCQEA